MSTTTNQPAAQGGRGSAPRALASVPTPREAELTERLASASDRVRLTLETSTAIQTAQQEAAAARRDAMEARIEAQRAEAAAEAAQAQADHADERAAAAVEEAATLRRQLADEQAAHRAEELARGQAEGGRAAAVQLAEQARHAA
ncbi:hypothetical protein, partial [Streptomyces parvus]